MNPLNLSRINDISPYTVWADGNELKFWTDHSILYGVEFKAEQFFDDDAAFWFDLMNRSNKPSPNDAKLKMTIICIIEEFFRSNPDILLYMCDSVNDQQAMRSRLFLRWFNGYEQRKKYYIRTELIIDEGIENYVALILQRTHPHFEQIIKRFDQEMAMFQDSDKP